MGMAASQARLLSITSRMADNELRSQIINNSKMRLATESSKVSEQYVNALNSATMMMSNYDTTGESQYQKLTFNSLTAYSSYNNQYGLVNANGKLLVSEYDANIYRDVDDKQGDLDDFLAQYGLKYESTYFTKETLGADQITFDDIGETYTIEELEEMYYGSENKMSYDSALQSAEYVNYSDYYEALMAADESYTAAVSEAINNDIFDSDWDTLYNNYLNVDPSTKSVSYFKDGITSLKTEIQRLKDEGKLKDSDWLETIESMINSLSFSGNTLTVTASVPAVKNGNTYTFEDNIVLDAAHYHGPEYKKDDEGEYVLDNDGNKIVERPAYYDRNLSLKDKGNSNSISYAISQNGCFGGHTQNPNLSGTVNFTYTVTEKDEGEDGSTETSTTKYNYTYKIGDSTATATYQITDAASAQAIVAQIILEFEAGIASHVNRDEYKDANPTAEAASEAYDEALDKYVELVFGNVSAAQKDEISADKEILTDPGAIIQWANKNGYNTSTKFEIIKQIYILDQLFEINGEPAAGWVDTNNPDENADAKVQWYTNLYNRMKQGFAVLEDGLASSNEWIEFAFESGLVTMEQVDTNNNWVSTIYTNCSDITEVTDDAAVAVAEAEYNKAMNNIENKDKRFDMELKNIDTEHNSLQTEYDSVKSVIDKNIERSFKIYS